MTDNTITSKVNKRKQQAEETRARIQLAALQLFEKNGFENVSIEAIARAAGCSPGNIYHYFSGKEAITLHMTDYVDEKFSRLAEKYRDVKGKSCGNDDDASNDINADAGCDAGNSNMTAREALIDFCVEVLKIDSCEELLFQCFIHSIRHPETGVLKINPDRAFFRILRERVEAFLSEVSTSDAKCGKNSCDKATSDNYSDILIHDLVIMIRGIMIEWRIEGGGFDLATEGRRLISKLLDGQ